MKKLTVIIIYKIGVVVYNIGAWLLNLSGDLDEKWKTNYWDN